MSDERPTTIRIRLKSRRREDAARVLAAVAESLREPDEPRQGANRDDDSRELDDPAAERKRQEREKRANDVAARELDAKSSPDDRHAAKPPAVAPRGKRALEKFRERRRRSVERWRSAKSAWKNLGGGVLVNIVSEVLKRMLGL